MSRRAEPPERAEQPDGADPEQNPWPTVRFTLGELKPPKPVPRVVGEATWIAVRELGGDDE